MPGSNPSRSASHGHGPAIPQSFANPPPTSTTDCTIQILGYWDPSMSFPSGAAKVSWFRANDIAQSDGTNVTSWTDGYGNHNLTGQVTYPTLQTNVIGGKSVVRLAAATSGFSSASFSWGGNKFSCWAFAKRTGGVSPELFEFSTNANSNAAWCVALNSADKLEVFRHFSSSYDDFVSTNTVGITDFRALFGVTDGSLGSSIASAWIESDSSGTRPQDASGATNFGTFAMFVGARNLTTDVFVGDIAEVGASSGAFSSTDRAVLLSYLNWYYRGYPVSPSPLTASIGTATVQIGYVTVSPAGNSVTAAIGTPTVTADDNTSPTGVSATASLGDVAVNAYASTGNTATASIGAATETADANETATGVSASGSVGATTVNSIAALGLGLTATIGSQSETADDNTTATGNSITSSLGSASQPTNADGQSLTTSTGTASITGDDNTSASGLSVTSAVGTQTTAADAGVSGLGIGLASAIGTQTETGDDDTSAIGISATASLGAVTVQAGGSISVAAVGVSAAMAIGDASITADDNTDAVGNEAVSAIGDVTVSAGSDQEQDASVNVTGLESSATLGNIQVFTTERASSRNWIAEELQRPTYPTDTEPEEHHAYPYVVAPVPARTKLGRVRVVVVKKLQPPSHSIKATPLGTSTRLSPPMCAVAADANPRFDTSAAVSNLGASRVKGIKNPTEEDLLTLLI